MDMCNHGDEHASVWRILDTGGDKSYDMNGSRFRNCRGIVRGGIGVDDGFDIKSTSIGSLAESDCNLTCFGICCKRWTTGYLNPRQPAFKNRSASENGYLLRILV